MSIAWGSLVLLIVLLPGVLFFVGLHIPEKFTRDTVEQGALAQLTAVLCVSLFVHGTLFWLSPRVCGSGVPCVDLGQFIGKDEGKGAESRRRLREWLLVIEGEDIANVVFDRELGFPIDISSGELYRAVRAALDPAPAEHDQQPRHGEVD